MDNGGLTLDTHSSKDGYEDVEYEDEGKSC